MFSSKDYEPYRICGYHINGKDWKISTLKKLTKKEENELKRKILLKEYGINILNIFSIPKIRIIYNEYESIRFEIFNKYSIYSIDYSSHNKILYSRKEELTVDEINEILCTLHLDFATFERTEKSTITLEYQ